MAYQIISMTQEHIASIAALERVCFSDPWSEAAVASELCNPLSCWLVAVCGGQLLGYVGSQIVPDEADVMNLAVAPQARQQGIAQALMTALIETLRAQGVRSLTLEVRASNDDALRLYDRLGFVQVGLRKNYYFHPKEDAKILKKEWEL